MLNYSFIYKLIMSSYELKQVSKSMSYLLRHGAHKENVNIDKYGFISIENVLNWLNKDKIYATKEMISKIVTEDLKGRYTIKEENNVKYIRANQGHSFPVELLELKPITLDNVSDYSIILHGTYQKFKDSISKDGLKSMSRQHVHMISLSNPDCFNMLRHDIDMYVIIDITKALKDGMLFYESANNVVLCPNYIPSKYLTFINRVKSPCSGVIVIGFDTNYKSYISMVQTPKKYWSFPKGKKEKGECSLQTAIRELNEETGINHNQLTFCQLPIHFEMSDKGGLATTYYTAIFNDDVSPENLKLNSVDPDELQNACWVPYEDIIIWKDSEKNGYLKQRRIDIAKQVPVDDILKSLLSYTKV